MPASSPSAQFPLFPDDPPRLPPRDGLHVHPDGPIPDPGHDQPPPDGPSDRRDGPPDQDDRPPDDGPPPDHQGPPREGHSFDGPPQDDHSDPPLHERPHGGPPEGDNGPLRHPPPFGEFLPPSQPTPEGKATRQVRQHYLQQAVEILTALTRAKTENPEYRYLTALCYREMADSPGPARDEAIGKSISILETLVRECPQVADYRFDLCQTYAVADPPGRLREHFEPGDASGDARASAQARLEGAGHFIAAGGAICQRPRVPGRPRADLQSAGRTARASRTSLPRLWHISSGCWMPRPRWPRSFPPTLPARSRWLPCKTRSPARKCSCATTRKPRLCSSPQPPPPRPSSRTTPTAGTCTPCWPNPISSWPDILDRSDQHDAAAKARLEAQSHQSLLRAGHAKP